MGSCQSSLDTGTKLAIVGAAVISVPMFLYMVATGGVAQIEPALISSVIIGGVVFVGVWLYSCDFNLFECTAKTSISGAKGIFCSITSGIGDLFTGKLV